MTCLNNVVVDCFNVCCSDDEDSDVIRDVIYNVMYDVVNGELASVVSRKPE